MRAGRIISLGGLTLAGLLYGSALVDAQVLPPTPAAEEVPPAAVDKPISDAPPDDAPAADEPEELPAPGPEKTTLTALEQQMLADRPRQYFRRWEKSPNGAYFSKTLHYKPNPKVAVERRQYVIFYPGDTEHLYLYDPVGKVYWGRFIRNAPAEACFQEIAPTERRTRLANIPEPAFGKAGPLPKLPGALDDLTMLSPVDTPALLLPKEEADVDPSEAGEIPREQRGSLRAANPPRKVQMKVIPLLPPPYSYKYTTETRKRWVPVWDYYTDWVNGYPVSRRVDNGYWESYTVQKKTRVYNYK